MSNKLKLLCLFSAGLLVSTPALAVDLVGVHDMAVKSDPRLKAAEARREATGENKNIARANLLPQLGAGANWNWGTNETKVPERDFPDSDLETRNYGLDLRQSLYRQANYESLDIARGQISQADALYALAYQDFLLRVSERYFLVLTLTDGVIFAEAEEKAFQRQFEQAEQRFEVGLTAVTDVHEARAMKQAPTLVGGCRYRVTREIGRCWLRLAQHISLVDLHRPAGQRSGLVRFRSR